MRYLSVDSEDNFSIITKEVFDKIKLPILYVEMTKELTGKLGNDIDGWIYKGVKWVSHKLMPQSKYAKPGYYRMCTVCNMIIPPYTEQCTHMTMTEYIKEFT